MSQGAINRATLDMAQVMLKQGQKPLYLVTATRLPTGAVELITNTYELDTKIHYLLEAYDAEMHLKTNPIIYIMSLMIVWEDL